MTEHYLQTHKTTILTTEITENNSRFNLALHVKDNKSQVINNRKLLAQSLKIPLCQLVFCQQTHSSNIEYITTAPPNAYCPENTDGLITNVPNIALAILTADCLPIVLYHQTKDVVAVLHAGWKGLAANIISKAIDALKNKFNCNVSGLHVLIGPGINQENYEVGQEVVDAFTTKPYFHTDCVKEKAKPHLDIKLLAKLEAEYNGIPEENIEISPLCTFQEKQRFFSARREGFHTGRQATVVMIKKHT
jgi:YfiH family protein